MSTPILVWAHRASLTRQLLMNKVSEPSQNSGGLLFVLRVAIVLLSMICLFDFVLWYFYDYTNIQLSPSTTTVFEVVNYMKFHAVILP